MEERKSLGRGLEEISSQFLSTPGGEDQFGQLIERLERLENKLGVELPAERESYKADPPTEAPQFQQVNDILVNLHSQIGQDYIASGIIGSNGLHLAFDSPEQGLNREVTSAYLAEGINNTREIIDKLSLGTIQSLMITTHHCYIFLHSLPGDKNYFLCLVIKREGNIGIAKLILERIAPQLSFT